MPERNRQNERARYPIGASVTLAQLADDPHPIHDRLRSSEPVSWLPALPGWLVTARAPAIEVLRDDGRFTVDDPRFSTAQVVGPSMLSLDGPDHRRHRRPFLDPFRAGVVGGELSDRIQIEATRLVERLRRHPEHRAELRTQLAGPLAVHAVTAALGLPGDVDQLLNWYRAIVAGVDDVSRGEPLSTRAAHAVDALRRWVDEGVASTEVLRTVAANGDLSTDELFANVAVVLFGAIETSEGMTANALLHCLTNRAHSDRTDPDRAAPDDIWLAAAIDESLRLEPAAAVVDRYTTVDTTLAGASIPAGDLVRVSLAAANRDPTHFEDPHRFDPTRPNAADHLAFVQGPHACLGSHLARLETQAALRAVFDHLPGVTVDQHATRAPTGLIFRKPATVAVTWPER